MDFSSLISFETVFAVLRKEGMFAPGSLIGKFLKNRILVSTHERNTSILSYSEIGTKLEAEEDLCRAS